MVVGIGVPRSAGLQRPSRLAALGIAQIRGDDTEFVREFVEGVERMRLQPRNGRVEPTARDHQQRKPRPGLLVMDADIALFVKRHDSFSLSRMVRRTRAARPAAPVQVYCILCGAVTKSEG